MGHSWYSASAPTATRHARERGEMQGRHAKARDGLNNLHEDEIRAVTARQEDEVRQEAEQRQTQARQAFSQVGQGKEAAGSPTNFPSSEELAALSARRSQEAAADAAADTQRRFAAPQQAPS
jgi:hypothetical protein